MTQRRIITPLVLFAAGVVLVGCNLPINPASTKVIFPTANQTMTAIFKPPVVILPTTTPPGEQTPTEFPTTTSIPTRMPTEVAPTQTAVIPSPSPASTNTPASAARPSWTASYLSTVPTIDGPWDDWKTTQFPIKNVVWGPKNWTGKADLEGAFRIGWDTNNLYLAVKVTDDHYVQNAKGADLFKGDSLELLVDANLNGDIATQALSADDYQVGISAGNPAPGENMEAYRWFPSSKAGSLTNVKIGAISMSDGYRVEAAIPWTDLGVTPADGQQIGFALSISDNDNTSANAQESMVSSVTSRVLTDPTSWGILVLKK
ncbi:MAG: sugar-binding protein [Anaerolineaceae bacterium]|nr:sugar-binding protein [Anaerolineaceae bacterium]